MDGENPFADLIPGARSPASAPAANPFADLIPAASVGDSRYVEPGTEAPPDQAPARAAPAAPPELSGAAISDPDRAASAYHIALASLANDPEAQINYFASKRFPDQPEAERRARYGIVGDHIVYREGEGPDAKFYREIPAAFGSTDPGASESGWGTAVKGFAKNAASGVGDALPMAGGLIGGILTAPAEVVPGPGTVANLTAAAAGAGLGQMAREGLAQAVTGQEPSGTRVLGEAGIGALGQAGGLALQAYGQRKVARDIGKLDTGAVDYLKGLSDKYQTWLSPAEMTNLPSQKSLQRYVGQSLTGGDAMEAKYLERHEQLSNAVNDFLNKISPVDSSEMAGEMGRAAGQKSIQALIDARAAKAKPLYDAAFKADPAVDVVPILNDLAAEIPKAKGGIKSVLQRVDGLLRRNPADEALGPTGIGGSAGVDILGEPMPARALNNFHSVPEDRLESLHQAKMAIDNMLSKNPTQSIGKVARARLMEYQGKLTDAMDAVSPEYAQARKLFSEGSTPIDRMRDVLVGRLAELPDLSVARAPLILFGENSGPNLIREAAATLKGTDPAAWGALKRTFIQDAFDKALAQGAPTSSAQLRGMWVKNITGNTPAAKRFQAALEPEELETARELGDLLVASSRVRQMGSDTAQNLAMAAEQQASARPLSAKVLRVIRNPLRAAEDVLTNRSLAANNESLARVITSPDAMALMKELKQLPPASIIRRMGMAQLLTQGGEAAAERVVGSPGDQPPGADARSPGP